LVLYEVGKEDESLKYFIALHEKYPNYSDGNAALAVMTQDVDLWDDVLKNDERYSDLDWITNVRRWPPKLIVSLQKFIQTTKMK
jgi:deoxyadenosine/deoxycytidine kinase